MRTEPLKGHLYVLDLTHADLRVIRDAKPPSKTEASSRWIRSSARFVRARCRGRHPADGQMFIFDIEEGTPGQFSLKSDPPGATLHPTYGFSPNMERVIPSFLVLQGDSGGIH